VLSYGHGDVVRGQARARREGLDPWRLTIESDRWYGRGTADNKGQHSINLAALAQVLQARGGRLGFNMKFLFEMGEETGSQGLRELCEHEREALAADLFLASDGPRVAAQRPTLFLGSRGGVNFDLRIRLRPAGHHSGNWGGLLCNPGIRLAHAIASLVDERGRILVEALRPAELPDNVRQALASIEVLAEDLRAVIAVHADSRPVVLVGHSIGGMTMFTLCRSHPALLGREEQGLVFVDTSHVWPLRTVIAGSLLRWPLLEPLLLLTRLLWPLVWLMNINSYLNGSAHLVNRFSSFGPGVTRGQLDFSARYTAKEKPSVVAKGLQAVMRWDESNTPPRLSVPLTAITVPRVNQGESLSSRSSRHKSPEHWTA
jgi:pimeloyl-ACP methyl ester carboxylesterase